MNYSDQQFGRELLEQLDQGYDPLRMARWADQLFLSGDQRYSQAVRDSLIDIFTMQEGEEFYIPEVQLRAMAQRFGSS